MDRHMKQKQIENSFSEGSRPLVSVVMTVFNGGIYIRESIESIINQTYSNFEFIIVNDASTDDTESIIKSFSDNRIIYVKNELNSGIGPSRNKANKLARGKYIATLDADDIAHEERLQKQVVFLEKNTNIAVCGSSFTQIDTEGKKIRKITLPVDPIAIRTELLLWNCICNPSIMIRKDVSHANPYKKEFELTEDFELWYRISLDKEIYNLPEALCLYRVHEGNISTVKKEKLMQVAKKLFQIILTDLKIEFSEAELDMHRDALYFLYDKFESPKNLENLETWFHKLLEHIRNNDKYDFNHFYSILMNRWITMAFSRKDYHSMLFNSFIHIAPMTYANTLFKKMGDKMAKKKMMIL